MYLASTERAAMAFSLPQLNRKVHTLEGLTNLLWEHAGLLDAILDEEAMCDWLDFEMGKGPLAVSLRQDKAGGSELGSRLWRIFDETPYGRSLDRSDFIDKIRLAVSEEEAMGSHYKQLGDQAFVFGDYRKSVALYRQALSSANDPRVMNNLGIAYMALEDYDSAKKSFERCLKTDDRPEFRMNSIRVHLLEKDYRAMLEALTHLSGFYEDPKIWYYYGMAYEGTGGLEEAIAAFSRAAEEGIPEGLDSFVRLTCTQGMESVLEAWFLNHALPEWLRLKGIALQAYYHSDWDRYEFLMEEAYESAGQEERLFLADTLLNHYLKREQVIKALANYPVLAERSMVSDEKLACYRIEMAWTAGSDENFSDEVDGLMKIWKGEARKASVR